LHESQTQPQAFLMASEISGFFWIKPHQIVTLNKVIVLFYPPVMWDGTTMYSYLRLGFDLGPFLEGTVS